MALHVIDIGPLGPLIQVGVRVGATYDASGRGGAPRSYTALIDTGAATTAISPKVVADVHPQYWESTTMLRAGATGVAVDVYEIRLKFNSHLAPGWWFDSKAVETTLAAPGVDVLIGQDLLRKLTVLSNGPLGKLVLMYGTERP
jgi:predicted aspartyl protease